MTANGKCIARRRRAFDRTNVEYQGATEGRWGRGPMEEPQLVQYRTREELSFHPNEVPMARFVETGGRGW